MLYTSPGLVASSRPRIWCICPRFCPPAGDEGLIWHIVGNNEANLSHVMWGKEIDEVVREVALIDARKASTLGGSHGRACSSW